MFCPPLRERDAVHVPLLKCLPRGSSMRPHLGLIDVNIDRNKGYKLTEN